MRGRSAGAKTQAVQCLQPSGIHCIRDEQGCWLLVVSDAMAGVGWEWVKSLSANHTLWVVTRTNNRKAIEACLDELKGLKRAKRERLEAAK